jgi:hypothetical protein
MLVLALIPVCCLCLPRPARPHPGSSLLSCLQVSINKFFDSDMLLALAAEQTFQGGGDGQYML